MKIIDIIEDKYEYAKAEYKMHKNTADCSYYMGYQDALGELIEQINNEILEEEKKIPEKLDHLIGYDIQQFDDLKEYVEITTNDLFGKINKIIDTLNQLSDYLKSKGE